MRPLLRARARAFSCRYLLYDFHGSPIRLPAVHVRISTSASNAISSFALVDSGATVSFVPLELAELLQVPLTGSEVDSEGAGGSFKTRLVELRVEIIKSRSVCWSKRVNFHVPTEHNRIPYIVLGRDTVFRDYDIIFRENEQRTVFRSSRRG